MTQPEAPNPTDSFRPVLGATVFLVLALLAIAALKSSRDLQAAQRRERQLEEQIAATRKRSELLRMRIDRLHNDPGLLERLAREDLGMVRPRDVVIELPAEAPAVQPAAAPRPNPNAAAPNTALRSPSAAPHPPPPISH